MDSKLVFEEGIETISEGEYTGNPNIKEVVIPNSVKRIDSSAFKDCTNLEKLYLGNGLTSGGSFIFKNCKKLKSVYVEDVKVLFNFCHDNYGSPLQYDANLYVNDKICRELIVPVNIKSPSQIGTFLGCKSIKRIVISRDDPMLTEWLRFLLMKFRNPSSLDYYIDNEVDFSDIELVLR